MKDIQNEKGIALVIAILTLAVFSILGLAIVTISNQGQKQRDFSNEQIEGKMLADTGLMYFQKYLDDHLKSIDKNSLKSNDQAVTDVLNAIATDLSQQPSAEQNPDNYKKINLPVEEDKNPGSEGSFQIFYQDNSLVQPLDLAQPSKILYQDDSTSSYGHPYLRKLKVSVIGIPSDTTHFRKVRLTATVYINTIASPFHYAISTTNELHLFGGSNIIGNVTASSVNVSTEYADSTYGTIDPDHPDDLSKYKDLYTINNGDAVINQPYVEGKILLYGQDASIQGGLLGQNGSDKPYFTSNNPPQIAIDRQTVQKLGLLMPKGIINQSGTVSADPATPYLPGSEPPLVEKNDTTNDNSLKFITPGNTNTSLAEYIKSQFENNVVPNPKDPNIVVNESSNTNALDPTTQPIWLGSSSNINDQSGFRLADYSKFTTNAIIYTYQNNVKDGTANAQPFSLTARLTGDELENKGVTKLLIGPDPNDPTVDYTSKNASVEMGDGNKFNSTDSAFSFNGSIFIKGNLDIVGDINVKGTIFVDGDVNIRENGGGTDYSNAPNLVILSTGKITITDRNSDAVTDPNNTDRIDWTKVRRLVAFLYSDNYPIEIYSKQSVNWFYGGLATGTGKNNPIENAPPPYIELDTKRKQDDFASHMTIQFNRGIFEKETPGLPSDNQFYLDIYDKYYDNVNPTNN
jgi:hypothetical protein